jgi:octaprenyl-diphosphate synthase
MSTATKRKSDEIGRKLSALYAPIAAELVEAEKVFAAELASRHPFVQHLVEHCADFRGKRLRPALVLLTAKASGEIKPDHAVLAAVVEMIHTATLVHDDILDESMIRRHAATLNAEWGNETAVLMGDYLFTHAFHLASSLETTLACRWIGHATNLVCEGEMQQVNNRGNFDLDEEAYFAIIRGKTAELTAVSCRLGAHYAGAPEATVRAMEDYGRDLGVAFQIADDVLDLWGEERATGKSLGTDLEKQKLTLPLIRLLETSTPETAESIRRLLAEAKPEDRVKVRHLLDQSEALQYAWSQAERYASKASAALDILPESPCKAVLRTLTHYVVRRSN